MQTTRTIRRWSWKGRKVRDLATRTFVFLLLAAAGILFLFPFFWMVSTSLKVNEQVYTTPTIWIPDPIAWESYPNALARMPFWLFLRNSIITSFVPVIGAVLSASLVAYSFSRVRWPGREPGKVPPRAPPSDARLSHSFAGRLSESA